MPKKSSGTHTIELLERHPGQMNVIAQSLRFNVLVAGRRWGKTELFKDLAVDGKHPGDPRAMLNGGRVGWWVGKEDQFAEVWKTVSEALAPISDKQDASEHQIWLPPTRPGAKGGSLKFWTNYSNPHAGRGREYDRAIIDEAAFSKYLEQSWQMSILPTLAITQGDAFFGSSPFRRGYFKRLYEQGQIDSAYYKAGWRSWRLPSIDSPYVTAQELEQQRLNMSDSAFRQEWLAEFLEDEGGTFDKRWPMWYQQPVNADDMYVVILCDPASGETKTDGEDYTVFWVVGLATDGNYYVLDFVRERYDLVERTSMLFALHRLFKPAQVGYERIGMQSDVQHIRYVQEQSGYRFHIDELGGQVPKRQRIERLVGPFKQKRIWFPGEKILNPQVKMARDAIDLWLDTEYLEYPNSAHDDGLDCLARIFDIGASFPNYRPSDEQRAQQEALINRTPAGRSVISGSY